MSASIQNGSAPGSRSVSIVIPTHNNAALLSECLQALQRLDYSAGALEILTVDNGSTDRTWEMLARRFQSVRIVQLETNQGFALACNKGAEASAGKYVAFLNNDAIADPQWLNAMFAALDAGPAGTVCAASRIMSREGTEIEYDGAGSNLFGAGRPHSTWGWPGMPGPPTTGSPVLFASGGAMLIERSVFLQAGGFDPEYFAYFEDVDLGWRLWLLGHSVVYAPEAVVRHVGGATGRRTGAHRRYTLWESNSLATVIKNFEVGNMERILSAALMLEYRRALLSAGEAIDPSEYALTAPKDKNLANVERLPKVSVAHLAAIGRLNGMLPHLMKERARIQALRQRSDREILPLLGRLYAPQFAGDDYADAAAKLVQVLGLFDLTDPVVAPRVLLLAGPSDLQHAASLAEALSPQVEVALAVVEGATAPLPLTTAGYTQRAVSSGSDLLKALVDAADVVLKYGDGALIDQAALKGKPVGLIGRGGGRSGDARLDPANPSGVAAFCLQRGLD